MPKQSRIQHGSFEAPGGSLGVPCYLCLFIVDPDGATDHCEWPITWCPFPKQVRVSIPSKKYRFLTDSQRSSSSNLTIPSPIPGFEARPIFASQSTLSLLEVYSNAIEMISILAEGFYSLTVVFALQLRAPTFGAGIQVAPWPPSSPQFQGKHAIQAVYDAGMALAAKPVTRPGFTPTMYAGMFIDSQQVGFLKWQLKRDPVAAVPNSRVSLINNASSNGTRLLAYGDGVTRVQDTSGVIKDPKDSRFTIKYSIWGKHIDIVEIFSAFLDAMATAARPDMTASGAHVNAVSISGTAALNVHEVFSPLSWSRLIRTLALLWILLVPENNGREMDFELFYDGKWIGQGFLMSMVVSNTSTVSSE